VGALILSEAQADWKIDFSRRMKDTRHSDLSEGEQPNTSAEGFLKSLFTYSEAAQDVVILHTETGFVPSTVRVRQGGVYRLHVVNVNEKERNVSFVMDAFSEHHATFFGKIKSFEIRPQKDGVFRFVSPETSAQGRLVVYPPASPSSPQSTELRIPASE